MHLCNIFCGCSFERPAAVTVHTLLWQINAFERKRHLHSNAAITSQGFLHMQGLGYRDNMIHAEVPAQRSSLRLDAESSGCLSEKEEVQFYLLWGEKQQRYSKFGVNFRLWPAESLPACICSCKACVCMSRCWRGYRWSSLSLSGNQNREDLLQPVFMLDLFLTLTSAVQHVQRLFAAVRGILLQ